MLYLISYLMKLLTRASCFLFVCRYGNNTHRPRRLYFDSSVWFALFLFPKPVTFKSFVGSIRCNKQLTCTSWQEIDDKFSSPITSPRYQLRRTSSAPLWAIHSLVYSSTRSSSCSSCAQDVDDIVHTAEATFKGQPSCSVWCFCIDSFWLLYQVHIIGIASQVSPIGCSWQHLNLQQKLLSSGWCFYQWHILCIILTRVAIPCNWEEAVPALCEHHVCSSRSPDFPRALLFQQMN